MSNRDKQMRYACIQTNTAGGMVYAVVRTMNGPLMKEGRPVSTMQATRYAAVKYLREVLSATYDFADIVVITKRDMPRGYDR